MTAPAYTKGQAVFVITTPEPWARGRRLPTVTSDVVSKIGRVWVTLASGQRFDPETGEIDGGDYDSPGRVWLSVEDHDRYQARLSNWQIVCDAARASRDAPEALSDDQLASLAAALLGGGEGAARRD